MSHGHRPTGPRRFRRNPARTIVIVLVLALLFFARNRWSDETPPTPAEPLAPGVHEVVRVVDGDTIIFAPHSVVRLIGVDTPETVKPEHPVEPFGPEASDFTRAFVSGGTARLEFDRERVDRFGRFLAYVWVGDRLLNEELLRAGLARWERHFSYSSEMKQRFREAEQQARRDRRGLWSAGAGSRSGGEHFNEGERSSSRDARANHAGPHGGRSLHSLQHAIY